jgi:predicted ATPase
LRHKRLLLILDNLEHLLTDAADGDQTARQADEQRTLSGQELESRGTLGLVADILGAAPGVCILVTSRIRLNMQGEHVLPIAGMDYPGLLPRAWPGTDHPATGIRQIATQHSAVALFLSAARRAQPGYELTNDNSTDVIRICHLVEGMPLGILLASSWVQVLSAADIADQIAARLPGHGLDFLEADLHDMPERHRSMRAVFDHSWTLLTAREREVLQGLSVFRGGFAREAGHQVTGVSLPELRALVNKSLIHFHPSGRYHMHELVRQYAAERLEQSPAASATARSRHCACYVSALQQWMADLKGPRQQDVLAEMDAEVENARAAWDWAVEHALIPRLIQAVDGLCAYYQWRGRLEEGKVVCQSTIEKLKPTEPTGEGQPSPLPTALEAWPDVEQRQRLMAKALVWQGVFTRLMGYAGLAGLVLDRCLAFLDALESSGQDVRTERAFALLEIGRQVFDLDRARAKRCFERSLDLYQALDDQWGVADTLYMLGWLADGLGDYDRARQALGESLCIRQALGDKQGTANSLALLGLIALRVGQLDQGENLIRQSVALLREMGERVGLADGLHFLGFGAFLQGRFEHGITLQEECLAIADDLALGHQRGMALQALGTYHANLGLYEQARAHATAGLAHARALGDLYVIGVTCSVLGGVSLAQEAYTDARRWFEQSLSAYQKMEQRDGQSWSLAYLGCAAQGLGDLVQARQHLHDALQIGVEANAFLSIMFALSGAALLMAHLGDPEVAIELWALLSRYPLISDAQLSQDIVGRHIALAAAALPPETVAAAEERGRTRDLNAAATEMLTKLG